MEFKYAKLRGRIVEKYGTNGNFCVALGISPTSLSLKLNNKTSFSQKDIVEWCNLLEIELKDSGEYFFA